MASRERQSEGHKGRSCLWLSLVASVAVSCGDSLWLRATCNTEEELPVCYGHSLWHSLVGTRSASPTSLVATRSTSPSPSLSQRDLSLYVRALPLCRISLSMSELVVCVRAIALTSRSIFSVYIRTSFEFTLSLSVSLVYLSDC